MDLDYQITHDLSIPLNALESLLANSKQAYTHVDWYCLEYGAHLPEILADLQNIPDFSQVNDYPSSTPIESLTSWCNAYQSGKQNAPIQTLFTFLQCRSIQVEDPQTHKPIILYYKNLYAETRTITPALEPSQDDLWKQAHQEVSIKEAQNLKALLEKTYQKNHPGEPLPRAILEEALNQEKHLLAIQEATKQKFSQLLDLQAQRAQTPKDRVEEAFNTFHDIQIRELGAQALRINDLATTKHCIDIIADKFHAKNLVTGLEYNENIEDKTQYQKELIQWHTLQGMIQIAAQSNQEAAYIFAHSLIQEALQSKSPQVDQALEDERNTLFATYFKPFIDTLCIGEDVSANTALVVNLYKGLELAHLPNLIDNLIEQDVTVLKSLIASTEGLPEAVPQGITSLYTTCLSLQSPLSSDTKKQIGTILSEGLVNTPGLSYLYKEIFLRLLLNDENAQDHLHLIPSGSATGFEAIDTLSKLDGMNDEPTLKASIAKWLGISLSKEHPQSTIIMRMLRFFMARADLAHPVAAQLILTQGAFDLLKSLPNKNAFIDTARIIFNDIQRLLQEQQLINPLGDTLYKHLFAGVLTLMKEDPLKAGAMGSLIQSLLQEPEAIIQAVHTGWNPEIKITPSNIQKLIADYLAQLKSEGLESEVDRLQRLSTHLLTLFRDGWLALNPGWVL